MTWFGGANENLQYPHGSAVLSSNRGKPLGSASVAKESAPKNFLKTYSQLGHCRKTGEMNIFYLKKKSFKVRFQTPFHLKDAIYAAATSKKVVIL